MDEVDDGDAFVCCHTNEIHILDGISMDKWILLCMDEIMFVN